MDIVLGSLKFIHNSLGLAPTWSTKPGNKYTKNDIKPDTNCQFCYSVCIDICLSITRHDIVVICAHWLSSRPLACLLSQYIFNKKKILKMS